MRSKVTLLAFGLFAADSVSASPCKARSSSSNEVTTVSMVAGGELATTAVATLTHEPSGMTTWEATTATSNVEDSETTAFEAITTTSLEEPSSHKTELETTMTISIVETTAASDAYTTTTGTKDAEMTTEIITTATSTDQTTTTAAPDTETTTDIIDTTTSQAETTTTAADAITTFRIIASGGSANGAALQAPDIMESDVIMFNPPASEGFRPRTYILDPNTGRVKDQDNGRYLCGYYQWIGSIQPAYVYPCTGTPGPHQPAEYLKCRIVRGKLSCTVPQAVCYQEEIGMEVTCGTSSGNEIFDHLYLPVVGGQYILIGKGGLDSPWAAIDLIAQEV